MDTIEDLTEDFLATGSKFREGNLAGMLTTHPIQFKRKMNNYKEQKSKGKSKANDVLFDTSDDQKIIKIRDYLKWINCHYDLELSTTINYDPHTLGKNKQCQDL